MKNKKKRSGEKAIIIILAALIVVFSAVTAVAVIKAKTDKKFDETPSSQSRSSSKDEETSDASSSDESTGENVTSAESTSEEKRTGEKLSVENNVTSESTTKKTEPKRSESGRIIVDVKSVPWNLIVVNMEREIPEGYDPETKEILDSGYELDARVTPHYEEMYRAGKKDGVTLTPFSGHRSYERQRINYNNLTETYMARYGLDRKAAAKKAATVILPPGTSEHNIGLAMDICNTYDSFANTAEYAWLMENAYKYGFILRYPKEKEDVTGIVYEPWHWRYVGVEYAKKIKDSGLCLEEYLDSVGIAY